MKIKKTMISPKNHWISYLNGRDLYSILKIGQNHNLKIKKVKKVVIIFFNDRRPFFFSSKQSFKLNP